MGINKVQYGNTTLIDLTSDTVTADKLMQGYTAHDRTGALITGTATGGGSGGNVWQDAQGYVHLDDEGTAPITVESLSVTQNGTYTAPTGKAYSPVTVNVSGGGGGLEYEMGTWTPSEDVAKGTVSFQNTHTQPPYMIAMSDSTGTNDNAPTYTGYVFMFFDYSSWGGYIESGAATNKRAGYISFARRNTGSSAPSVNYSVFTYGADNLGDSSASYSRYYANENAFYPECNNASVYWRAGRTYKWIAVWAPTT